MTDNADDVLIDPKEKLLCELMLSSETVFSKVYSILDPDFFASPLDRVVEFVLEYFREFHSIPAAKVIRAETDVSLDIEEDIPEDEIAYLLQELEAFCREKSMTRSILDSVDLVQNGELEKVQELVRASLLLRIDKSIGTSLYDDPENRIITMAEKLDQRPIGIKELDEFLGGGHRRGELGVIAAGTSRGKSIFLANIGYYQAIQSLNVLTITLELSEDLYLKRYDSIFTGEPISRHTELATKIGTKLREIRPSSGEVHVKHMRGRRDTVETIRAFLTEYHLTMGFYPDVLLVDYLAILGVTSTRTGNRFDEDEEKAILLRGLLEEFNMYGWTVTQLTKEGEDAVNISHSMVAGGKSLLNTCDIAIAAQQSDEDLLNNQFRMSHLKTRNTGRAENIFLYRDPYNLRITGTPGNAGKIIVPKTQFQTVPDSKDADIKKKLQTALRVRK